MFPAPKRDLHVYVLLIGASVVVRLPFLGTFDLVSFDGTYYINQARVFWSAAPQPGSFPVGYPFFISLLLPLAGDGVRAAQVVSFLASIGSVVLLHRLALRYLDRAAAFCCAAFLAVTPLFVRLSLATFSESLFTCLLLLALWTYARGRDDGAGAAGGLAAVTRPEMLGIAGVLVLLRARMPRRALLLVLPFVVVYSLNAVKFYQSNGRALWLPKTEFFGAGAQAWGERERTAEERLAAAQIAPDGAAVPADTARSVSGSIGAIAADYAMKLPEDLYLLARNVGFVLLVLAAFGMWRRPTFLLAVLVPLLVGPLFTVRSLERYLLPYVPVVILYGFVGAGYLRETRLRDHAVSLVGLSLLLAVVLNAGHYTGPVDDGFVEAKEAGLYLRDHIEPGDIVADRKPYVAFYAGARYLEIPFDSYQGTMEFLVGRGARFLALHLAVLEPFRPIMSNLVTDPAVVAGELRYRQVWGHEHALLVYERTGADDPLRWTRVDDPGRHFDASPAWSPDGDRIAFSARVGNHLDIFVVPAEGGDRSLLAGGPRQDDQPAWSPDGRRVAFSSNRDGDWNVHVLDRVTGEVQRLTRHAGHDGSPCWSPGGKTIYFMSDRSGKQEIWSIAAGGGTDAAGGTAGAGPVQLTDSGDNNFPAVSPDGTRLAWTRLNEGLFIRNLASGREIRAPLPREVNYAPAWSPGGRYLAVSGRDWGSVDVYLVTADGRETLLLTKNVLPGPDVMFDAMPSWSPDGTRLAVISTKDGTQALYVLDGLGPYLDRLENPVRVVTFEPGL